MIVLRRLNLPVHRYNQNEDVIQPVLKQSKRPVSKADYQKYKYVLPSAQTIANYKYLQASEIECDAAVALLDKNETVKVTLHYDTTSRNSIDGEWPSLILHFSDGQNFHLRPLFYAYEDRNQITNLIVER